MNCREFLVEFEDRNGNLTEAATLHLTICLECRKTSDNQTRVWLMIDNLRHVDAPKDFEFHVKARIAKGKPSDLQTPKFLPVLRYVLPAVVIVFVVGLVAYNTTLFSGGSQPQLAAVTPTTPIVAETPLNNFSASNQIAASEPAPQVAASENRNVESVSSNPAADERKPQFVAATSIRKSPNVSRRENSRSDFSGSRVKAATSTPVLLPENLNPNKTVTTLPNANNQQNTVSDAQILEFIGIETVSDNGGKKVKTVKADSMAERSGVKVGDVIEAIDGRKISGEPQKNKQIEGKTLTIKRGAEKIEINLQNKPD